MRSSGAIATTVANPSEFFNDNPILDTRLYTIELPNGAVEELAADAISEKLWAQCDEGRFMYQILDKIVDHRTKYQEISKR